LKNYLPYYNAGVVAVNIKVAEKVCGTSQQQKDPEKQKGF
jgi:hypothetical protein